MYDDARVENALAFVEANQQIQYEQAALQELEQEVTLQVNRLHAQDPSIDVVALTPYVQQQVEAAGTYDAAQLPYIFDAAYADYSSNHTAAPPPPRTIAEATSSMMADLKSTRR